MKGLRTQESIEFERFFEIVQRAAETQSCVFFLDCGEGNDFDAGEIQGEELSGWLIPQQQALLFEAEWLEHSEQGHWDAFYTFALWNSVNGNLEIEFNTNLILKSSRLSNFEK